MRFRARLYLACFGRKNLNFQRGRLSRAVRHCGRGPSELTLGGKLVEGQRVELIGIEPTTSGLQSPRSPS